MDRASGLTILKPPGHLSPGHLSPGHLSPGHLSPGHAGPPWWCYLLEVLDRLRLPYRTVDGAELSRHPEQSPLLVVAAPVVGADAALLAAVDHILSNGGAVVQFGGAGAIGTHVGVVGTPIPAGPAPADRTGALLTVHEGTGLTPPEGPLRGFGGEGITASKEWDTIASWSDRGAIVARRQGRGWLVVSGADPFQSIVRIQQGWPVRSKGPAAPDGTTDPRDDLLRCDDGMALHYDDRAPAREDDGELAVPIFDRPQADEWRALVLQLIFDAAQRAKVFLPWLDYWPSGVPAIAHLSHDSDRNDDDDAAAALDAFAAADLRSTWCHCHPGGYSAATVAEIGVAGHEHALHYNAVGAEADHAWGLDTLAAQLDWCRELAGAPIVANKNHYTRWEGGDDFYRWCERLGIQIDESRGPSRMGTTAFDFGTTQPWFPMSTEGDDQGRRIDVLQLPLHAQDLGWTASPATWRTVVERAKEHHGIAHVLFHGYRIRLRPHLADLVTQAAQVARDLGLQWWTAGEINRWERARRGVTVTAQPLGQRWQITITSTERISNCTILVPTDQRPASVQRHGRWFAEVTVDLEPGVTAIETDAIETGANETDAGAPAMPAAAS